MIACTRAALSGVDSPRQGPACQPVLILSESGRTARPRSDAKRWLRRGKRRSGRARAGANGAGLRGSTGRLAIPRRRRALDRTTRRPAAKGAPSAEAAPACLADRRPGILSLLSQAPLGCPRGPKHASRRGPDSQIRPRPAVPPRAARRRPCLTSPRPRGACLLGCRPPAPVGRVGARQPGTAVRAGFGRLPTGTGGGAQHRDAAEASASRLAGIAPAAGPSDIHGALANGPAPCSDGVAPAWRTVASSPPPERPSGPASSSPPGGPQLFLCAGSRERRARSVRATTPRFQVRHAAPPARMRAELSQAQDTDKERRDQQKGWRDGGRFPPSGAWSPLYPLGGRAAASAKPAGRGARPMRRRRRTAPPGPWARRRRQKRLALSCC